MKYRITEKTYGDGRKVFVVEYRYSWWWPFWEELHIHCGTLEEARRVLELFQMRLKSARIESYKVVYEEESK